MLLHWFTMKDRVKEHIIIKYKSFTVYQSHCLILLYKKIMMQYINWTQDKTVFNLLQYTHCTILIL